MRAHSGALPGPIMSATHLKVDIFYHILSHIIADIDVQPTLESSFRSGDSKSDIARRTLARLARAHSSFTKPALSALWGCLPNDEPLRHLLRVIKSDQYPALVCATWFGSFATTLIFYNLAGKLSKTRYPRTELAKIPRICLTCANYHYRPVYSHVRVPIKTPTRHVLGSTIICPWGHAHPSSLEIGYSLQHAFLQCTRLRHGFIASVQPIYL